MLLKHRRRILVIFLRRWDNWVMGKKDCSKMLLMNDNLVHIIERMIYGTDMRNLNTFKELKESVF